MKVKCYKGLKGCDTETIEIEKSADAAYLHH